MLAAIRRGDRGEARRIINHVLVHIYSAGQERSDLLKGLLLELVVMISRAAVEAGAVQSEVLGLNFRCLTQLAEINDDEELAAWLRQTLEHMMSALERQESFTPPLLIGKALDFMRMNLDRDISRDETARHAGISPSHFSRVLKERTGRSFTELLRQSRVDLACDLLRRTEDPLAQIAAACGFCDQSYFTHVFQEVKGETPGQFRAARPPEHANSKSTRPVRMGGTGDPPVPVGDPPTGMRENSHSATATRLQVGCPQPSAGPVARRDGRVVRATHARAENPGQGRPTLAKPRI